MPSVAEQSADLLPVAQDVTQLPSDNPPPTSLANVQVSETPSKVKTTNKSSKGKGKASKQALINTEARSTRSSLRGGIIGLASADPPSAAWLPAGGGARKALPEAVLPFRLPTLSNNADMQDTESSSSEEDDDDRSDRGDHHAGGQSGQIAIGKMIDRIKRKERRAYERSLLHIQSLRQSRLFYLASLLAPYHRRTKAGVFYPLSIPSELLHGIEPSVKGSHILAPLPRIEVQVGPHVFTRTKLWEMKKERDPPATGSAAASKKAQAGPSSKPQTSIKPPQQQAPVRPAQPVQRPPQPLQSHPPAPRPGPPTAAATAAVDPVLVTRVNERASKDADLRDLLQVAARGAATPDQLRVLGEVIQDVTREMERDGLRVMPPQALMRPPPPPAPLHASATVSVPGPSTPRPDTSTVKTQKKKGAVAGASDRNNLGAVPPSQGEDGQGARALSFEPAQTPATVQASRSPPKAPADARSAAQAVPLPSFRPPILILEFRENTSMRFYVPLGSSLVARRRFKRAREFSEGGEEEEELVEEPTAVREQIECVEIQLQFLGPVSGSDAAIGTGEEARYPISMTWTAEDASNTLWEAIGRVPWVKTLDVNGREVSAAPVVTEKDDEEVKEVEKGKLAVEELEQAINNAIASLPPQRYLDASGPLPRGLEDHLADKFAPQLQMNALPSTSGTHTHQHGGNKRRSPPLDFLSQDYQDGNGDPFSLNSHHHTVAFGSGSGSGGVFTPGAAPKPKKKRNVATHNPDGTLKRCNACGTNVTPMWRRGPDGPATLCNACGARWKSGRLGMPSVRGGRRGSTTGSGSGSGIVPGPGPGAGVSAEGGEGKREVDEEQRSRQDSGLSNAPDRTRSEEDQQQPGEMTTTVETTAVQGESSLPTPTPPPPPPPPSIISSLP